MKRQTKEELKEITRTYEEVLKKLIDEHQGERCLIIAEVVGTTGTWVREDKSLHANTEFFGYDRGISAVWNLIGKKQSFKGLKYDTYLLGIGANPAIRSRGMKFKDKLEQTQDKPEEIARAFKDSGEFLDSQNTKEIELYARESPTVWAIKTIEQQTNDLVLRMGELGLFWIDVPKFMNDPFYRSEVIGQKLIRYILENSLKVKKSGHVFIADNSDPVDSLKFDTSVPIKNVIWEKYPGILSTPK